MSDVVSRGEGDLWIGFEPEFKGLLPRDAKLRRLWADGRWAEGPSYLPIVDAVVFSDIPNDRQMLYSGLSGQTCLLRGGQQHFVNGSTPDGEGGLLLCEHGTRALSRLRANGTREILADHHQGGRLNSPNDVVRHPDGSIWFTDPTYGLEFPEQGLGGEKEQAGSYVYRLDLMAADLTAMTHDFAYPNGLAFSPDGRLLYVADSAGSRSPGRERHIRVFDVGEKGEVQGGRTLIDCPMVSLMGSGFTTKGEFGRAGAMASTSFRHPAFFLAKFEFLRLSQIFASGAAIAIACSSQQQPASTPLN